jgi:hypothetical protein
VSTVACVMVDDARGNAEALLEMQRMGLKIEL